MMVEGGGLALAGRDGSSRTVLDPEDKKSWPWP